MRFPLSAVPTNSQGSSKMRSILSPGFTYTISSSIDISAVDYLRFLTLMIFTETWRLAVRSGPPPGIPFAGCTEDGSESALLGTSIVTLTSGVPGSASCCWGTKGNKGGNKGEQRGNKGE